MTSTYPRRDVSRVESPTVGPGIGASHKVRRLVPPTDFTSTDPFLLLMEDWFPLGVFDRHPHRGFETVTYVLEGAVNHYDNHGNTGIISSGDALWLTAGRGIVHNEEPANGEPAHLLQLWVNLPAEKKLIPARFQELRQHEMPVRHEPGAELRVFSGSSGNAIATTKNHTPVTFIELRLQPAAVVEQELEADYNAFIVVLEGSGAIGTSATEVGSGQVIWLTRNESKSSIDLIGGKQGLRAVLFAGRPLREPIAARGPFVMNTAQEIESAFESFRTEGDRFGH